MSSSAPAASPFAAAATYRPSETRAYAAVMMPESFAAAADEYRSATQRAALVDRSDRGLALAHGKDRRVWLHNLITNDIKGLADYRGAYAFAVDVRGRVQFDLNVLALPDALWLDIDAEHLSAALRHLDRYLLSEAVVLQDISATIARLGVCGPDAGTLAATLGAAWDSLAPLAMVELDSAGVRLLRHDFAGLPGFELFVPVARAPEWWERLATAGRAAPIGARTVELLRIESGIPRLGRDFDDTTVAPETGQIERAINYHKGCYLGQEVIERMRSRGAQARRLVRLRGGAANAAALRALDLPAPLSRAGSEVGRVTSLAANPLSGELVGLGYVRSRLEQFDGLTAGAENIPIELAQ